MKAKWKWLMLVLAVVCVAAVIGGGAFYITSVFDSLWEDSVTDILEVTIQGRHALDTYVEKDMDTVHLLATDLSNVESSDAGEIYKKINLFNENDIEYICIDLTDGIRYSKTKENGDALDESQLDVYKNLQNGSGVREPFFDDRTGVRSFGNYEKFEFADGNQGLVQKTQPLTEIADRFSLSFYDDSGFSYVVNRGGDILVRSQHRNSNRTFQNLFDIIDHENNDHNVINSFKDALKNGKKGVARFKYDDEDYVFCYVPFENVSDWYIVSIIPDAVIMEQAQNIVKNTQIWLVLFVFILLLLGVFFAFYLFTAKRVLSAKEESRKAAESANLAKSRFLSQMSHDIRTPMNAIICMTQLAQDHTEDSEKMREYLKNIELSGKLLTNLINDVLDLSKIESGKMALNNVEASLDTLLNGVVMVVQPSVFERKQRFEVRAFDVKHESLRFDTVRLNQVLINLLSNAVKFTPSGGTISFDVFERPSEKENCGLFVFRVSDTGIGMKPEFIENLFSSFTRETDSRVDKIEGSGLGMAITKMIVDMMDGAITVESTPGQGTIFTVQLTIQYSSEPEDAFEPLPSLRVFVADDDTQTCESIGQYLQNLGCEADLCASGTAIEDDKSYDLILLDDARSEDDDMIQTVRDVRAKTGADVPLVIFSAYDSTHIEADATSAGANGFLQKPLLSSTLYHCIRQYVLHAETAIENQRAKEDLSGKRVLLVEDNEINQEIAKEILANYGIDVDAVDNGRDGVESFASSETGYYDLILMDIHMPIMDGYEATVKIRTLERPDALSIPILAMTADAFAEDIELAKDAGMNGHLSKPIDIPAMLNEIRRCWHC